MRSIMTRRLFFAFLVCLALPALLKAQQPEWVPFCGTKDLNLLRDQVRQAKADMEGALLPRGGITYVPVRFFLVAKSDGSSRVSEKRVLDAMCVLNENFADMDIQFYIKQLKFLNHNTIYSNPGSTSGQFAISNQLVYDAINIFITGDAGGQGVLGYYQPPAGPGGGTDYIVVLKNEVHKNKTLSHEVGHFLGLLHPFHGWEDSGGWDPNVHGMQVGFWAPDGQTRNEKMDGSNCNMAADEICDTPPDYLFWNFVSNCNYFGQARDPDGVLVVPMLDNFMNYIFSCTQNQFTTGQKNVMTNFLFHPLRNYVRPNFTPNTQVITQTPTLKSPVNGETLPARNNIKLEWEPVPGADQYLVELSITVGYSVNPITKITSGTSVVIEEELLPDRLYYWHVKPYNASYTCADFSPSETFVTGSVLASREIEEVDGLTLLPNPVNQGAEALLEVNAEAPFEAELRLLDVNGRLLLDLGRRSLPAGTTLLPFPTGGLAPGMYLVVLQSDTGRNTRKLVVLP